MSQHRRIRRERTRVADWAARAMVVAGGVLLLRLIQPQRAGDGGPFIGTENERLGRGEPTVPPSKEAEKAGHETVDLSGWTLTVLTAGLGATVAVVIGAMVLLHGYVVRGVEANDTRLTVEQTTPLVPPLPHVQATPVQALDALQAREQSLLEGYGWVDAEHTRARIPIDRAMKLIVGQQLDAAP